MSRMCPQCESTGLYLLNMPPCNVASEKGSKLEIQNGIFDSMRQEQEFGSSFLKKTREALKI